MDTAIPKGGLNTVALEVVPQSWIQDLVVGGHTHVVVLYPRHSLSYTVDVSGLDLDFRGVVEPAARSPMHHFGIWLLLP
jgi:hypothetical protein